MLGALKVKRSFLQNGSHFYFCTFMSVFAIIVSNIFLIKMKLDCQKIWRKCILRLKYTEWFQGEILKTKQVKMKPGMNHSKKIVSVFGFLPMELSKRSYLGEQFSKSWAIRNQYLWSYGQDIEKIENYLKRRSVNENWIMLCFTYDGKVQFLYLKISFPFEYYEFFFSFTFLSVRWISLY